MNGQIAIDFTPSDGVVPRILKIIECEGFVLRGLRLIPCRDGERCTLALDLDGWGFGRLGQQLLALAETIEVIHRASWKRA